MPLTSSSARQLAAEAACLVALGAATAALPRIPQPESYHNFADQRRLLGIPHALNVLSNAAIALPGVAGLWAVVSQPSRPGHTLASFPAAPNSTPCWVAVFAGMLVTAAGSAYYHLAPNTPRLAWDRLGMALTFASLLAAVLAERRMRSRASTVLALMLLLAAAAGSVAHWRAAELDASSRGDLRWYALVQGLSAVAVGYLSVAYPSPHKPSTTPPLLRTLALYGAALLGDRLDRPIYYLTFRTVSGHTLKHLLAGLAGWQLVRMLRQPRQKAT